MRAAYSDQAFEGSSNLRFLGAQPRFCHSAQQWTNAGFSHFIQKLPRAPGHLRHFREAITPSGREAARPLPDSFDHMFNFHEWRYRGRNSG